MKAVAEIHPVDQHVGARLRLARLERGLSQTALGKAVGITFQQIQKYERGTNRISASMLFDIATVLGLDVRYFFDGMEQTQGGEATASGATFSSTDLALLRALNQLDNDALKRRFVYLLQAAAPQIARAAGQASALAAPEAPEG